MIIGSGMVAQSLWKYKEREDILIFASGVSFSKESHSCVFEKEKALLIKTIYTHQEKLLIYFSTCSIYNQNLRYSEYVNHKIKIESLIKRNASNYLIFRVSNLVGISKNPHTIINYLLFSILNETPITIWKDAYRNLLDIDDFVLLVNRITKDSKIRNTTINLANPRNISILTILKRIEFFLKKNAKYQERAIGRKFNIETKDIQKYYPQLNFYLKSPQNYLDFLLNKHYVKYKG